MKKKIASILVAIFTFAMLGSGCAYRENQFVYGDFICQMDASKTVVNIAGLSEEGKLKEVIIIPEYIDNLPISGIINRAYIYPVGYFDSTSLKRIYYRTYIPTYGGMFCGSSGRGNIGSPNLEKVFIAKAAPEHILDWCDIEFPKGSDNNANLKSGTISCFEDKYIYHVESPRGFYVSYEYFKTYIEGRDYYPDTCIANVTYNWNYSESENQGVYWIDDYNYGAKIEYIPDKPAREGYDFDGWYKEAECVTPWDFENDALPQEQRTEDGLLIYQETKLFAKWIKN